MGLGFFSAPAHIIATNKRRPRHRLASSFPSKPGRSHRVHTTRQQRATPNTMKGFVLTALASLVCVWLRGLAVNSSSNTVSPPLALEKEPRQSSNAFGASMSVCDLSRIQPSFPKKPQYCQIHFRRTLQLNNNIMNLALQS